MPRVVEGGRGLFEEHFLDLCTFLLADLFDFRLQSQLVLRLHRDIWAGAIWINCLRLIAPEIVAYL